MVQSEVVGREREIALVLATVKAGRDLLLEGPPGTSKTTLLKAITDAWGIPLVFVEGNAELTPGRLLGHHDPSRVLQEGYVEDAFEPGPLVEAMRSGGFLYFEEFNRAPEDTLNTLLTAIADRRVAIPRLGTVEALPTFRLIGSMNPHDNVGTTRLSVSIKDRLNRLVVDYQDADAEVEIVRLRSGEVLDAEIDGRVVRDAVAVTRATRRHEGVLQGSSVRGAIDLALIANELGADREGDEDAYRSSFWEAMLLALSGRISLDQAVGRSEEAVLREIWEDHFILAERIVAGGENELETEETTPVTRPSEDLSDRADRPFKVKPKELDAEPDLSSGPGGSGIATATRRDGESLPDRRPGQTGLTTEEGQLDDEEGELGRTSRALRARTRANEIAARLALRQAPRRRRPRRGGSEVLSAAYRGSGGEIDLDRTMDILTERRVPMREELFVRERRRTKRRIVLAVDVSGSMRGERLLTAAATVGALSTGLDRDDLAVIAFWSDAAALLRLGERVPLERLVDEMVALDAGGLTNVAFPLELAAAELGGPGSDEQRVLLLSDCVHNAGPDPCEAARRLPRLDVLFDVGGERDSDLARRLARAGRGLVIPIRSHRDIAPALSRVLGPVD